MSGSKCFVRNKKRILFILPSLKPGGAEKVVSFIAQHINRESFDPYLLILYKQDARDFVIKNVPLEYLRKRRTAAAIPSIIKKIIEIKPNILFTSIGQLNLLLGMLSLIFKKKKFIVREASISSVMNRYTEPRRFSLGYFTRFLYSRLDKIICQSVDMAHELKENLGIDERKITVIGNPVVVGSQSIQITKDDSKVQLITVGRLSKEKGIDRLLPILKKLEFKFHYTLIGDGKELDIILEQIHSLGLENRVTHIPYTNEVSSYLASSDLFLQGSYVEGFPNALLESCAVGVPVIAFDAPGGTRDIIVSGVNGFIVGDAEEFLKQLNFCLFDYKWDRDKIIQSVNDRYGSDKILCKYEELFNAIC